MKNITIAIEEEIVSAGRAYAKRRGISLNALIRELLRKTISKPISNWHEEAFQLMDQARGNSKGTKWKREDLYDV